MFPKETRLITNESFVLNVILFFIYIAFSIVTFVVVRDFLHIFLVWNLFLAVIPYALAFFLDREIIKSKVCIIITIILWLFFFPNSMYIMTDLIYTNSADFISQEHMYAPIIYIQSLSSYLALFHIYLGSILGLLYGFKSLSVMYNLSKETRFYKYRVLMTILVFVLSSIGIYIGRFFRYNSWEFLKLFSIVSDFFTSFSWFTVFFVCSLTMLQIIIFYGYKYNFIKKNLKK